MSFSYKDRILSYNGENIFEAPMAILHCLSNAFNGSAIILYDAHDLMPEGGYPLSLPPKLDNPALQEKINQNIFCIDKNGNVLWRVEKNFDYPVYFNQLYEQDGELWAYRTDSRELCIDRRTGHILKQQRGL